MTLDLFNQHNFLNIETFRKDGRGVQTPVWFVREGDALYVWTQADSGKAKRIRRDGRVRIAPCTARGDLLGDWLAAVARTDASPAAVRHVKSLMQKKYGLAFRGFQALGQLRGAPYTTLQIQLDEAAA